MIAAGLPVAPTSADASTPAAVSLTVTPATLLLDDQSVTVAGAGYPPDTLVAIAQCKTDPVDASGCDTSTTNFVTSDGGGAFSFSLKVTRVIRVGAESIDCATTGACIVGAGVPPSGVPGAGVPIQFDPDQPLPPPPTATVDPATGLADGQSVAVRGSGFEALNSVTLIQCAVGGGVDGSSCDLDSLATAPTDGAGGFSTTFRVRARLDTATGPVDCTAAPDTCMLAVVWPGDITTAVITPLRFGSDPPATNDEPGNPPDSIPSVSPRFTG